MLAAPPPSSSRTLAQVTAKVYHAKFGSGDDWQYFNQRGTVIFGQDQNQNRDEEQGATATNAPIEGVGLTPAGLHYWFRLRDESNGRIVWMFQVPEECLYRIDKPFFHVFNGKSRMWGFLFDNDLDGQSFGQVVQAQLSPHVQQNSPLQRKLYNPFSSTSSFKRDPSLRSKGSSKSVSRISRMNSTPTLTSAVGAVSGDTFKPRQPFVVKVTPSMISLPQTQSFVHIGHIGLNSDGFVECSEGIASDPSWSNAISDLVPTRQKRNNSNVGSLSSLAGVIKHRDNTERFKLGIKKFGSAAMRSGSN